MYKDSSPGCVRLRPSDVFIDGSPCHAGANANLKIFGYNEFPSGKTLTAGDYQYRVYEQGVRSFVSSGADDIMKHISINEIDFELNIPFTMPPKNKTGEFTVAFQAKDQDKVYDLCLELLFNYTSTDDEIAAVAQA
jgi:hypothetical protein